MGNRAEKSSPRHGIRRDFVREEAAREAYKTRAKQRPKQTWDEERKCWNH